MLESTASSIAAKEMEAYATDDYVELLQGLKEAVEVEEKLKWQLMDALQVAERKKAYMYKHKNYDVNRALKLFDLVKNLPKRNT
jgi:hypothetical protein